MRTSHGGEMSHLLPPVLIYFPPSASESTTFLTFSTSSELMLGSRLLTRVRTTNIVSLETFNAFFQGCDAPEFALPRVHTSILELDWENTKDSDTTKCNPTVFIYRDNVSDQCNCRRCSSSFKLRPPMEGFDISDFVHCSNPKV